jgi:hypothetical protein
MRAKCYRRRRRWKQLRKQRRNNAGWQWEREPVERERELVERKRELVEREWRHIE